MHALNLSHSCCLALTRSRLALFPSSTSTSEASQRSERSRASIKSGASKSVKRGSERGCMLAPSRCLAVFLSCSSHFAHLLSIVCKGRKKEWRVPIRRPHQSVSCACLLCNDHQQLPRTNSRAGANLRRSRRVCTRALIYTLLRRVPISHPDHTHSVCTAALPTMHVDVQHCVQTRGGTFRRSRRVCTWTLIYTLLRRVPISHPDHTHTFCLHCSASHHARGRTTLCTNK